MIHGKHTKQISEEPVGAQQAARGRHAQSVQAGAGAGAGAGADTVQAQVVGGKTRKRQRARTARAPLTPAQRFARDVLPWIVIVVLILGVFCYRAISDTLREQGVLSIRTSIINAAEQCYAIEGAYPSSLNQLMEQYGIRYDKSKYVVNYNVFAANVPPTVTVTAR